MRTILEADALEKSWSGRRIFSGISLSVERGLTAVSGENGSGKTTLLKILAFLLRPDSGAVRVRADGENAAGDRRRRAVGWAGPDLAFYEDLTGEENLLFFRRAGGMPASRDEIRARLAAVGLAEASDRFVGAFSTGMKQRLRLAFATLFDAPILLLDEPAAGLDLPGRETAFRIVEERRRTGAVILASSDPRDFDRPDAVVELGGGRETGNGKRETGKLVSAVEIGGAAPRERSLPRSGGLSFLRRAFAVCAKDAALELRRRVAVASVLFFSAACLALVSFAIGPFGLPADARETVCSALLWVVLFFSAATGLPRAFVREEESGTALALRTVAPAAAVVAGKAFFNFLLFAAIAAVTVPAFSLLLGWQIAAPGALAAVLVFAGAGLSIVSTFLSALVARASQKSVLFVLVSFPLVAPLLLSAIVATVAASRGEVPWMPLRVLVAYDGAAACGAYLLASAAWDE